MAAAAIRASSPADSAPNTALLASREVQAGRAADTQGLSLRRSKVWRISNNNPRKYRLVCSRNNQLVANDLELDAVEAWLGIQSNKTD